jgi:predicted chitinase
MQITGRGTYEAYQNDHAQRNPNDIKDFLGNPDFVTSSKEYEVASGCSYWFNKYNPKLRKNLNPLADEGATDEVVLKVSATINGYYDKKALKYNQFSTSEKAKYLKAEDDLYLKIPNGYNEPNKPFSRLPLFHKLKNHMGL